MVQRYEQNWGGKKKKKNAAEKFELDAYIGER